MHLEHGTLRLHEQPGLPRGLDLHSVDGAVRAVVRIDPQELVSDEGSLKDDEPKKGDSGGDATSGDDPSPEKKPADAPSTEAAKDESPDAKPVATKDPRFEGPLGAAWTALERGDHVEAASLARALAKSEDEVVRRDAEAFLQRLKPDPVILMVFAATGLLLLLLAWQYLGRHR